MQHNLRMHFANSNVKGYDREMAEANVILIKKYENRRLYDTVNSRYVNLEEVASLLQKGYDVRVVDALSGHDITRLVLTQIIVEDAKAPNSTFPIEVLRQMVVASGRATQTGARLYMQAFSDLYEKSLRAMTPPFPFPGAPQAPAPAGESEPHKPDDSIDELKRRLAELEALVARLSPEMASSPGTSRS